jgi:hypothetical protein
MPAPTVGHPDKLQFLYLKLMTLRFYGVPGCCLGFHAEISFFRENSLETNESVIFLPVLKFPAAHLLPSFSCAQIIGIL